MTRHRAVLWLILAACAPGCSRGGSSPAPSGATAPAGPGQAPSVTAEELTAPEGHLALGPVTLLRDGKPALALAPDGSVTDLSKQEELGRMHRDGRFLDPGGRPIAQLTKDGEVMLPNGDFLPVTVGREGALELLKEGREIRLEHDGSLTGANPGGPIVTFSVADTKLRRAAMFLLVLVAFPTQRAP